MYSANTISRMFETTSTTSQFVVTNQMLTNTYAWFAKRHPQLIVDLLDKTFFTGDGKPIINNYVNGAISRQRTAVALAEARERQLIPAGGGARKRRVADMTMAADGFLKLLRTELD